jgi:CRP-like cAMP-binding protein
MGIYLALRLSAFTRLSAADREALEKLTAKRQRQFAARRDLIREGDKPRSIFLMLEGWACRYKQLTDGRRQIVSFFIPGDLCDMNVFILKEMDHSIGAINKVRAAEIGREDFDRLMREHPRITQALYWNELVNVAVQREWTVDLGQRSAYERLAHLFCELFVRLEAVELTTGHSFDFPLTQTDLADAMGLTTVHVNRMLRQLREDGLIEFDRKSLTLLDLERLKRVALFNPNYLHMDREGRHLDAND